MAVRNADFERQVVFEYTQMGLFKPVCTVMEAAEEFGMIRISDSRSRFSLGNGMTFLKIYIYFQHLFFEQCKYKKIHLVSFKQNTD